MLRITCARTHTHPQSKTQLCNVIEHSYSAVRLVYSAKAISEKRLICIHIITWDYRISLIIRCGLHKYIIIYLRNHTLNLIYSLMSLMSLIYSEHLYSALSRKLRKDVPFTPARAKGTVLGQKSTWELRSLERIEAPARGHSRSRSLLLSKHGSV